MDPDPINGQMTTSNTSVWSTSWSGLHLGLVYILVWSTPRSTVVPIMSEIVLAVPRLKPSLLRENYKEHVDKYICPKCDSILWEAVQTSCGHWLCNGCAEELFDKKYVK